MTRNKKLALGCLSLIGLALIGVVGVVLNWDATREALDAQSKKTQATLFRLGESGSIGAELKAEYGTRPDVAYETDNGGRVLSIVFDNYLLPKAESATDHAREIAVFALGKTTKLDQIDTVNVSFGGAEPHSFAMEELIPRQPLRESS